MAFSQDDLDKLEKAIKSGAQSVEYSSGKVTYRSLDDMLRIRDMMRRSLGLNDAIVRVNPQTSKGL